MFTTKSTFVFSQKPGSVTSLPGASLSTQVRGLGLVTTTATAKFNRVKFPRRLPHKPQSMGTVVIWLAMSLEFLLRNKCSTNPHAAYHSGQVHGTCKSGAGPSLGNTSVPLRTLLVRSALLASRPRWGLNRQSGGHFTRYNSTPASASASLLHSLWPHPRCAPRPRTTSRPVTA